MAGMTLKGIIWTIILNSTTFQARTNAYEMHIFMETSIMRDTIYISKFP